MFIQSRVTVRKVFLRYGFLLRAGYLTLFERRDNAAAVYKEFRTFDSLLTKLARCSLKRGRLHITNVINFLLSICYLTLYTAR